MHKIEGQVITEKTDIWQLGLNLAFEWYKVDLSKLSSWKYVRTLPKFLHFLYFYAKRGFDPREMDHIQQLELELKTQIPHQNQLIKIQFRISFGGCLIKIKILDPQLKKQLN